MSEQTIQVRHRTVMDDETRHVARVYAEALYKAAEADGTVDTVLEELEGLTRGVYRQDPGLELFFVSSPRVRVLFMSGRVRRADGRAPH